MPEPRALNADECAPVMRAIAEPIRLRIISTLRHGPLAVFELTERLGIKQYQASRHLTALFELGVVTRARQGKRVIYGLSEAVRNEPDSAPSVDLGCCRFSVE
ncbi:hypothetical protein LBMAG42_15710 [Deltaproteobacteria bacterium]|nr:hypothetical protein LBMAG42_15710 [Deltaproteobacteria bacterium]